MSQASDTPQAAVGFYMSNDGISLSTAQAIDQALRYFPWLKRSKLQQGQTFIELWGHREPEQAIHWDRESNLFVLIGSPMNIVSWQSGLGILERRGDVAFEMPWEGRCVLIRVSKDGSEWTIWNDWTGCIPVFHSSNGTSSRASSLEPAVVAAGEFTVEDLSKRGLVELLMLGHYIGTDTLFCGMQTLPIDSLSRWNAGKFLGSSILWTVQPSDKRWGCGWDELVDELHAVSVLTVKSALADKQPIVLPLSSGMDSRLLACIAADQGISLETYTYGPSTWIELVFARQLAQSLHLPWHHVEVGTRYLSEFTPMWFDWFGISLHAHGMYQMPFLKALEHKNVNVIVDGWYGNNTAGGDHPASSLLVRNRNDILSRFCEGYSAAWWPLNRLRQVLSFDPLPFVEEIVDLLESHEEAVKEWPFYQRMNWIDRVNRQARFVFYQPMMYDYWKGSCSPYMHREYARFWFSLPRAVIERRRLQKDILLRYYPKAAAIGGTAGTTINGKPLRLTKSYLVRMAVASIVPNWLRVGPLQEFNLSENAMEPDCVRSLGIDAIPPMQACFQQAELPYLNAAVIREYTQQCLVLSKLRSLSLTQHFRIQVLQPLIHIFRVLHLIP